MCLITTGHARRSLDTVHTHHSLVWRYADGVAGDIARLAFEVERRLP
jgi:hypothetical protein